MTVLKFLTWWDYLQVAPQPPWWWKFELNNPRWKLKIALCSAYISWNNRHILMFKVSKWPYWSSRHDRNIWKYCHCLPGAQKWNWKIISAVLWQILMFKVSKQPYQSFSHDKIILRWRTNPPGGENLN